MTNPQERCMHALPLANCSICGVEARKAWPEEGALAGLAHYVPPTYERILWRGAYLDLPVTSPDGARVERNPTFLGIDPGKPGGDKTVEAELELDPDGNWRIKSMRDSAPVVDMPDPTKLQSLPAYMVAAGIKPVCWFRTKDGKLDWSEDCVGQSRDDVADGWEDNGDGYGAIPLYAHPPVDAPKMECPWHLTPCVRGCQDTNRPCAAERAFREREEADARFRAGGVEQPEKARIAADGSNCPSNPGCGCLSRVGSGICRRACDDTEERERG